MKVLIRPLVSCFTLWLAAAGCGLGIAVLLHAFGLDGTDGAWSPR